MVGELYPIHLEQPTLQRGRTALIEGLEHAGAHRRLLPQEVVYREPLGPQRTPFIVYGVLLWGFGLGGGYVLAYRGVGAWPAQQSPAAFWQAAAGALLVTAVLVQAMLRRTSRRAVALQTL